MTRYQRAWFRQPVVWLGGLILVASLGACVVTILLAFRYGDTPVATSGSNVLRVPLGNAVAPPPVTERR
jgi:quinol-cytochrome oxidoreductase complex cytochrome b subunit